MLQYFQEEMGRIQALGSKTLIENVSRRSVLGGGLALSGFVLAVQVMPASARAPLKLYPTGAEGMPNKTVSDPKVFVSIDKSGTVKIISHRAEMGTGIRTSLPMVVADEMDADWARVVIEQSPGDEVKYGNQDTDGSRSMRHFIQAMRTCGASVRTMLEQAAAAKWGVDAKLCRAKNHEVHLLDKDNKDTGKKLGYGELAEAAMALPVPAQETLLYKEPGEFTLMGKGAVKITDLHDITTGKAVYGADIRLPGMKFAMMTRPPVLGSKVAKFDAAAALKVPGVEQVFELEGIHTNPRAFGHLGGVVVVANSTFAAMKGKAALVIEWTDSPNAKYTTTDYKKEMLATASQPGMVIRKQGDPDAAFKNAKQVFSADYVSDHINQASMEPLVAVADVKADKADVWAPIQSPGGAKNDVAKTLGLKPEDVTVHMTLLGGGFGRKSKWDYMVEAALVSKKVGSPILLQWSREDDMQNGFYHTVSNERIEMAIDDKGKVTGYRHRSVAPSIISTFKEDDGNQFFIEHGMNLVNTPFEVPNVSCETGKAMAHTRIGWFRSVANIPKLFAVQSAVTEVAYMLKKDPKDFLLELIGSDRIIDPKANGYPEDFWHYGDPLETFPTNTARLKKVINVAAEAAGWGKKLPARHGLGIAAHIAWHTYVCTIVHAAIDEDGTIRIPQITTALDCGFAVNPERVKSQIEGAAVMGMSLALHHGITYKNGAVEQSNFTDYPVCRMSNFPKKTNVIIVDGPAGSRPSGVGEPGLPPVAPAIANAIFAASGKRMRSIPMGDKLA